MTSDKREEEKPVGTYVGVQTSPEKRPALLFDDKEKDVEGKEPIKVGIQTEENLGATITHYEPEIKFLRKDESSENEKESDEVSEQVSVGIRTQEKHITSTVVYYEPEMKFLRRQESSKDEKKGVEAEESRGTGMQTQQTTDAKERSSGNEEESTSKTVKIQPEVEESKSVGLGIQEIPTIIYYEPEMKFLTRTKGSESVTEVKESKTTEVQTQSSSKPVTVICSEPEMKPLRRKDESENRGVLFNNEAQIKEIQGDAKDKFVGTEPKTLEHSESEGEREELKPALTETLHDPTSKVAVHRN